MTEPYIYYEDEFVQLWCGDVRSVLPLLPAGIAQTCVTSPPYFGLRDYGTADWEGGDATCDHLAPPPGGTASSGLGAWESQSQQAIEDKVAKRQQQYPTECKKCGAVRIDSQIGLESTPVEFLGTMTDVFDEVRRVLRPGATAWVNMGDSYNGTSDRAPNIQTNGDLSYRAGGKGLDIPSLKSKDLVMMPAELAITLRNAGWWLRSEIIWAKPNPMPESVTDRPTKSHEQIYLLANAQKYFYDAEAIREPSQDVTNKRTVNADGSEQIRSAWTDHKDRDEKRDLASWGSKYGSLVPAGGRNARTVWAIAPQPFSEAHFATFPPELPERCIKAGTSEYGQCVACGDPYTRIVEKQPYTADKMPDGWDTGPGRHEAFHRNGREKGKGRDRTAANRNGEGQSTLDSSVPQTSTIGWQKTCKCETDEVEPQIVLEPFAGAGTTLIAAKKLGRRSIGIELNPDYCKIIVARIQKETAMPLFDA